MSKSDEDEIGYGKPPKSTRFRKGQSGNPKGRPKKKQRRRGIDSVLDKRVSVSFRGKNSEVPMEEAIALALAKRATGGDARAARIFLDRAEQINHAEADQQVTEIRRIIVDPKACNIPLSQLGVVQNVDDHWRIESWVIEAALKRNPSLSFAQSDLALLSNSVVDRAALQRVISRRAA